MGDLEETYKNNDAFVIVQREIDTKISAVNFADDKVENTVHPSDQAILATSASNELLQSHSIAIAHLLRKLPDDEPAVLSNDNSEAITGQNAATKMVEQQQKANFILRQVEKSKLDQVQLS